MENATNKSSKKRKTSFSGLPAKPQALDTYDELLFAQVSTHKRL